MTGSPTQPQGSVDQHEQAGAQGDDPRQFWSRVVRDRWFFGVLTLSTAAILVLFIPYMYVLMLATIVVVVTWPLYERILRGLQGRRAFATMAMLLLLFVGVLVPAAILAVVFVRQALTLVQGTSQWVGAGGLDGVIVGFQDDMRSLGQRMGFEVDVVSSMGAPLQEAAFGTLQKASTSLPRLIGATMGLSIDAAIFLFATATLYLEGPKLMQVIRNLVPMDDVYENKLFVAFRKLANNMVGGTIATGLLQGLVAAVGFAIAGIEQVVFLGILTALGSFVPLIGTALVWIPVALYALAVDGFGWALFIVLWSVLLTASVDNFLKPLFLRGGTQIHPLLIFLGVFGGLAWMGVPGVLVGPVIVAFFVAMYTSYVEDFLRLPRSGVPLAVHQFDSAPSGALGPPATGS